MKQKLPILLVVLVALGLLFGGAIHSTLHADEGGDCHFCHLTVAPVVGDAPTVSADLPALGLTVDLPERVLLPARRRSAPPRAPPVI